MRILGTNCIVATRSSPASTLLAGILLVGCLTGCATVPEAQVSASSIASNSVATEDKKSQADTRPVKPFAVESLYDLLVADIALTRNQFDTALPLYLQQARETRDSAIIELAARVAGYRRDHQASLEMALLLLELEPENPVAHDIAMQSYALLGDAFGALPHAHWLYENLDDLEGFLAVTSIKLEKPQISQLISAYQKLELSSEKQPTVLLASAILLRDIGLLSDAEAKARQFVAAQPDNERGLLLLAQILHQQDRIKDGTTLIAEALERQPENRQLRLQYSRFLTLTDRPKAIAEFETLREQNPMDHEINFLLALLLHNQGNSERAEILFAEAAQQPSLRADSQFHLGNIAENRGDVLAATKHYAQVRFGRNFLPAVSRLTILLNRQYGLTTARENLRRLRAEQPQQSVALFQIESNLLLGMNKSDLALSILSDGLQAFPNDSQLLYARSMVAEQLDNFKLAEQDLRALIALDGNNATALNALGYTMILHTDRLDEAHRLIKRAYLLNPGDPAIIDSMGWILFQLGQVPKALEYLQKALKLLPDPEIAAHLGEVQWVMGDRDTALQTWHQSLQQAPEHPTILETMQRLGVPQ
jgi:tetratricopeptide (TPR) repeat protein